jgi:hypothetical protein
MSEEKVKEKKLDQEDQSSIVDDYSFFKTFWAFLGQITTNGNNQGYFKTNLDVT